MSQNRTFVQLDQGREVLISYRTPVAAFIPGVGYVKTSRKYSKTTSRHVNQYAINAVEVSPREFQRLISPLVVDIM